jgi:hypothetical protein
LVTGRTGARVGDPGPLPRPLVLRLRMRNRRRRARAALPQRHHLTRSGSHFNFLFCYFNSSTFCSNEMQRPSFSSWVTVKDVATCENTSLMRSRLRVRLQDRTGSMWLQVELGNRANRKRWSSTTSYGVRANKFVLQPVDGVRFQLKF